MQDDTLELLISIGHYARVNRHFDEARYMFDRLALLYPRRAFPYLGLGLVEVDRLNYRSASLLFGRATHAAPDSALAFAWLGVCQLFEGNYALGARTLMRVADSEEAGAGSMATAFLKLPECAPFIHAAHTTPATTATTALSTIERLTIRSGH
jgi:hypothetical protein